MKVLLSAYACEPDKGSEPAIGWQWALEIVALGHEVWVLTRKKNRQAIEGELSSLPPMPNLHFVYCDLPPWVLRWKKGIAGIYLYYYLWQWAAYRLAKEMHARQGFDRVHHITFVSIRLPSFMGNLGIPFVFGPVGGGERAPWRLRRGFGPRGWLLDGLRDLSNTLVRFDPFMLRTFKQAERIYVTSEQTRDLVPRAFRHKTEIELAVGLDRIDSSRVSSNQVRDGKDPDTFHVLYVGRLLYWKGMHLGLRAFAKLLETHPDTRLTIIGDGAEGPRWRSLAHRLGVSEKIDWIPWLDQHDLLKLYPRYELFLYPSLHDSGGMVVLEAMAHDLPVVCLDLGGPGTIVDDRCGRVISTRHASRARVIEQLGHALIEIAENQDLRHGLTAAAFARVREHFWKAVVGRVYSTRRSVLRNESSAELRARCL